MDTATILLMIDQQLARLEQARSLLSDQPTKRKPGRPKGSNAKVKARHNLSQDGRKRIAEAVRKRWAAYRKAAANVVD